MSRASTPPRRPFIGGQAVIEGVLMRAPGAIAVVVRRKNGDLVLRERPWKAATQGPRSWPFIRGIAAVRESLAMGSQALRWSAALYDRDLAAEASVVGRSSPRAASSVLAAHLGVLSLLTRADDAVLAEDAVLTEEELEEGAPMRDPVVEPKPRRFAAVVPLLLALFLFVALPQGLAELVHFVLGLDLPVTSAGYQALTGAAQLAVLIGYLLLLRRIPEIRTIFEYHGAEHKTVTAYEAGVEPSLDEARARTTLHARCGTTFLVMIGFVSIVAFSIVGAALSGFGVAADWEAAGGRFLASIGFFLLKLPLLPVVAAATFELQRLFARVDPAGPLRFLLWPGFLVQRITTAEPNDDKLEVAIGALGAARRPRPTSGPHVPPDRVFSSFAALTSDRGHG